jgi:hypothetical protein
MQRKTWIQKMNLLFNHFEKLSHVTLQGWQKKNSMKIKTILENFGKVFFMNPFSIFIFKFNWNGEKFFCFFVFGKLKLYCDRWGFFFW